MPLVQPDLKALEPEPGPPAPDRAPDWVADGTPEPLRTELTALLGEDRVLTRAGDLIRYASDASPYRLIPRAVVMARDVEDISRTVAYGRERDIPVVFRAGGSSLNGQSQTDGILVEVRRNFGGVDVRDGGRSVSVGPGVILGHANRVLEPYGFKIGPDPASTEIATIGGVVANNSGGMKCGTTRDSYSTVTGMTFVLPSGTVIDSTDPAAEEQFAREEPELAGGLLEIREEILADPELTERIRRKFAIKNTVGYRLCAFLDAETPVEIFRRLLIGSEGTLGFIARVEFETVEIPEMTTLAWLHFPSLEAAVDPVPELVAAGATAVELMVAPALITASWNMPGAPEEWKELDPESAALLVEFGGPDDAALDADEKRALDLLQGRDLIREVEFSRDEEVIELNWRVREGLHGLVGKIRPAGTSLIVEDVCVPPERIAQGAQDLRDLLAEHGFLNGVAGHASAGNLHFMLTPDFSNQEDLERYEAFMAKLVELICHRYDGSLKAEHGTGINMAPWVPVEWGEKATELMWRVKRLSDPDGVLGPGIVLTEDPEAHLRNLKTTPPVEESVTSCVECGFCEPVCPSQHLTTTPRQRIALRREMVRQGGDTPLRRALIEQFEYDGLETCATDSSCMLACPVGIDTGSFVKELRSAQKSPREERLALRLARRWDLVEKFARAGLRTGRTLERVIGSRGVRAMIDPVRTTVGEDLVPDWGEAVPGPASATLPATSKDGAKAVYLPACINRIFGPSGTNGTGPALPQALVEVSRRAGQAVWIPSDVQGSCCSVPFSSKGYGQAHSFMANDMVERLWRWTDGGELPVVIDASSCGHGIRDLDPEILTEQNRERHAGLEILDSLAWAESRLMPNLDVTDPVRSVTIHPTCSGRLMGETQALRRVASALAGEVRLPPSTGCCGFAGDRGMLHPELTASATAAEAREVKAEPTERYVSTNRTCEIGLERATGMPYRSVIELLEETTRPV